MATLLCITLRLSQLYNVGVLNMVLGNHQLAADQLQRVYDVTGAESVLPKLSSARAQANQQAFLGTSQRLGRNTLQRTPDFAESFALGLNLLENGEPVKASAHFEACASMAASLSDRPAQAQAMYHQACCAVAVHNWDVAADCLSQAVSVDHSLAAFARGDDTLAPLLAARPSLLAPSQGTGLSPSQQPALAPALPPPIITDSNSTSHTFNHRRSASGSSGVTDSLMGHEAIRMARLARTDSRGSLISMVSMDSHSQSGTPLPIAAARSRAGGLLLSTSLDSSVASSPKHRRGVSSGSSRRGNSMSSASGDVFVTTRHARSVSNGHSVSPSALADAVGMAALPGSGDAEGGDGEQDDCILGGSGSAHRERSDSVGTLGLDLPEYGLEGEGMSGDLGAIADAALATVQAEERFEAVQQAVRQHQLQALEPSPLHSAPVSVAQWGEGGMAAAAAAAQQSDDPWSQYNHAGAATAIATAAAMPSVSIAAQPNDGDPHTSQGSLSQVSLPSPLSSGTDACRQDSNFNLGSGRTADESSTRPLPGPLAGAGGADCNRPASNHFASHRRGRAKTDSLLLDLPPVQPTTSTSSHPVVLGSNLSTPRPGTAGAAASTAAATTPLQRQPATSFWGNALRGLQAAFTPASSSSRPAATPPSAGATPRQPVPLFESTCIDDSQDTTPLPKVPSSARHKRSSRAASQDGAGPLDISSAGDASTFASPRTSEPSPGTTRGFSTGWKADYKVMPRGDSDASDVSLP